MGSSRSIPRSARAARAASAAILSVASCLLHPGWYIKNLRANSRKTPRSEETSRNGYFAANSASEPRVNAEPAPVHVRGWKVVHTRSHSSVKQHIDGPQWQHHDLLQ